MSGWFELSLTTSKKNIYAQFSLFGLVNLPLVIQFQLVIHIGDSKRRKDTSRDKVAGINTSDTTRNPIKELKNNVSRRLLFTNQSLFILAPFIFRLSL